MYKLMIIVQVYEGPNEHVVWDTEKINSAGGKGMWYDEKNGKFYERNHFVKKMRVPTKEPIIGKGNVIKEIKLILLYLVQ